MSAAGPLRDVRTRLLAIVLCTIAVAVGVATYGFNVLFEQTSARDADTLLRSRADSEGSVLQVRGNRLVVVETKRDLLGDSNVWIFDGRRAVEVPHSHGAVDAAARSLAAGPARFLEVPG